MPEITAKLVRELREATGAGMMDCKKALEATAGAFDEAIDHLRKQGLKSAEKKSSRTTGEGRVLAAIDADGRGGSMVSVACETDFVARTPDFEGFLSALCAHVTRNSPRSVEELEGQAWGKGQTVGEALKSLIGKLGENIKIVEVARLSNPKGLVASYVHHNQKVGVLVSITTDAAGDAAQEMLHHLSMHIAFAKPEALFREELPAELLERERAIYLEEVRGKPQEMQEKIVAGKLEKFYASRVLPEQPWVKDDKLTVDKALKAALGKSAQIEAFACFQIGA